MAPLTLLMASSESLDGVAVASVLPHGAYQRRLAEAWGINENLGFLFHPRGTPLFPFLCSPARVELLFGVGNSLAKKDVNVVNNLCQHVLVESMWEDVDELELPPAPTLATIKRKVAELLPRAMAKASTPEAIINRSYNFDNVTWASNIFQDVLKTLVTLFQMGVYETRKGINDENLYIHHVPVVGSEPTEISGIFLEDGATDDDPEDRFEPTNEFLAQLVNLFANPGQVAYPLVVNNRRLSIAVPEGNVEVSVGDYALSLLRICADPAQRIIGNAPTGVRDMLRTDQARLRVRASALWFKQHVMAIITEFLKRPALREAGLYRGLCLALLRWVGCQIPLPKLANSGVHLWVPGQTMTRLVGNPPLVANPAQPLYTRADIDNHLNHRGGKHTARANVLRAGATDLERFFDAYLRQWTTYVNLAALLTSRFHAWVHVDRPETAAGYIAYLPAVLDHHISNFIGGGNSAVIANFRLACPKPPPVELSDDEKAIFANGLSQVSFGVVNVDGVVNSAELIFQLLAGVDVTEEARQLRLDASPASAVIREIQIHEMVLEIIATKFSLVSEAVSISSSRMSHAQKFKDLQDLLTEHGMAAYDPSKIPANQTEEFYRNRLDRLKGDISSFLPAAQKRRKLF